MSRLIAAIPLFVGLCLVGCGSDDPAPSDDGSGGSGTGASGGATGGSGGAGTGGSGTGGSGTGGSGGSGAGATIESIDCTGVTPQRSILTPDQVLAALDSKDFELVNVHVPYAGEIVGTDVHIPYTDVDGIETYLEGDTGRKVLLYCLTGPMSEIAGDELVDRGYCNVWDMPAGLATWKADGYPYNE
jgi:rhodanese-related sulfurtransferase